MKKIITLFTACLITFLAFSQDDIYTLKGSVVDGKTQKPIPDVAVQIYGTLQGTVTDVDGKFQLSYTQENFMLSFSRIGYEKRMYQIKHPVWSELSFTLQPKTDTLQEAVVKANRKKPNRQNDQSNNLLDYTFYGDNVLALSNINHAPKLVLLSPKMDTLSSLSIPKRPQMLYKDCLGNNHIVFDTVIYQVFYDREKLQLVYPTSAKTFDSYLFPCVGEDEYNLYFRKIYGSGDVTDVNWYPMRSRDSVMDYYMVNKRTKLKSDLTTIANPQAVEVNTDLVKWIDKKEQDGLYIPPQDQKNAGNQSNRDELRRRRLSGNMYVPPNQKQFDYLFFQQVLFKEIYAPLFVIRDTVFIFNYENSKIQCYYMGNIFDEVEIRFHKDKNCKREILLDKKNNRIYAVFENNGITSLKEVNLKNGALMGSYEIPYPYAENIRVYNNYLYFLRTINEENILKTTLNRIQIN